MHHIPKCRVGFTMIELLVSITMAMILASLVTATYLQVKKLTRRAEARLHLHHQAETIYTQLSTRLAASSSNAAMVAEAVTEERPLTSVLPTLSPPQVARNYRQVRFLFMRALEDHANWETSHRMYAQGNNMASINRDTTDMIWELWEWREDENRLYMAVNSPARNFSVSLPLTIGSLNYQTRGASPASPQPFINFPQARRTLNPANWKTDRTAGSLGSLDDNIYFPNGVPPAKPWDWLESNADPADVGDWGDLRNRMVVAADGVTTFDLSILQCNEDLKTFSSTSDTPTVVWNGLPMDGRLNAIADLPTSDFGLRPRLARIRMTLRDPQTGTEQVFSFSFQLPGPSGTGGN